MITIKTNVYNEHERIALLGAMQAAVDEFINTHCDPQAKCQTCTYRHTCYDLIKARDYMHKLVTGVDKI